MAAPVLSGCDLGEPARDEAQGPPLRVLATHPADGQGVECGQQGPPECGVPLNTTIEFRFDRYLDPRTAVRQAIRLYTGDADDNRVFDLEPEYDVIERVLVYRFRGSFRLEPRTLYRVEVVRPEDDGSDGLRAFDQAPLGPGPVPLAFSFFTGAVEVPVPDPRAPLSCEEVVERRMLAAGCTLRGCHNGIGDAEARMQLDLSSEAGLFATAIDRVAHQTDLGPTAGVVLASPSRFGVNMARIRRFAPESSYLLYKLLVEPRNFRVSTSDEDPCLPDREPAHNVALPDGACIAPSADEIRRLREWFVRGEPMPIVRSDDPTAPLAQGFTRAQLRDLSEWIRAGAACP